MADEAQDDQVDELAVRRRACRPTPAEEFSGTRVDSWIQLGLPAEVVALTGFPMSMLFQAATDFAQIGITNERLLELFKGELALKACPCTDPFCRMGPRRLQQLSRMLQSAVDEIANLIEPELDTADEARLNVVFEAANRVAADMLSIIEIE